MCFRLRVVCLPTLAMLLFVNFASASTAFAWGERGHDLVARVAVRLIIERATATNGEDQFAVALAPKEHLLGHLANVPDIVWRSIGRDVEEMNAPTHYIDLEYFAPTPKFDNLPKTPADMVEQIRKLCAAAAKDYVCPDDHPERLTANAAGTAPWRVQQLYQRMRAALTSAKGATGKDKVHAIDEALLDAGIMAHFVGDLGNPWHTTRDYNGWETGQGGVHAYFEEQTVNAETLALDEAVFQFALKKNPVTRVAKALPVADRAALSQQPLALAWALVLDSNARLSDVRALDRKVAVMRPSKNDHGLRLKAERKDPRAVRDQFQGILVDRLATAADVLATLWLGAWREAGRPDLRGYQSYDYPTAPTFIATDYLPTQTPMTATPPTTTTTTSPPPPAGDAGKTGRP